MFKKSKKKEPVIIDVNKENYSVSIADYLRNDMPTKLGVQSVVLSLIEKNYLTIQNKHVNLGTPWAPNEQDIIQLALSNSVDPDKLTVIEDHMIKWLIFTFGDGVYSNLTQVYEDVIKKDFITANSLMFEGYKKKVISVATQLNLVNTDFGAAQKKYYEEEEKSELNSKRLIYNQSISINSLTQKLIDLFDQTL
jgi:hypothetical protein